ncbi:MAG: hypothetical protein HY822_22895 [Acidobacteria bacterium]|nr:hypothetical protein [Acidobacteriota bacterium]
MASPAQAAANAQRSTGPRTPEGKARSSQNACKHGLTAREAVVAPEDKAEFDEFLADYRADLQPEGVLEETLFSQLVTASWNLRRIRRLETGFAAAAGADPLANPPHDETLDRWARYAARAERSLHRAIRQLRELQTARMERESLRPEQAAAAPRLADLCRHARTASEAEAVRALLDATTIQSNMVLAQQRAHLREAEAARLAQQAVNYSDCKTNPFEKVLKRAAAMPQETHSGDLLGSGKPR